MLTKKGHDDSVQAFGQKMLRRLFDRLFVFSEHEGEEHQDDKRVSGKNIPARLPAGHRIGTWIVVNKMVNGQLGEVCANGCAESVRHDHEKALRAAAYVVVGVLLHKQRTRDVEEVESHAIDNH